jgi:hypothetical protein
LGVKELVFEKIMPIFFLMALAEIRDVIIIHVLTSHKSGKTLGLKILFPKIVLSLFLGSPST